MTEEQLTEGQPTPIQKRIEYTVTNGLGFMPDLPESFGQYGIPDLMWRLGYLDSRISRNHTRDKALGSGLYLFFYY